MNKEELLHQISQKPLGEQLMQLVLPEGVRGAALHSLYDYLGHLGLEQTTDLFQSRFYWPRINRDTEHYVKSCRECIMRKSLCKKAAPFNQIVISGPMDLVHIDFLSSAMSSPPYQI